MQSTMEENYVEGELGVIFTGAVPLTLPQVAQLLRERCGKALGDNEIARARVQDTLNEVELLQETSSSDEAVADLIAARLRLRADGGALGGNAHLAGLQIDEHGNVVLPGEGGGDHDGQDHPHHSSSGRVRRVALRRFEVVALATLTPGSVQEALLLVPSLARYDGEDLAEAIVLLQQ